MNNFVKNTTYTKNYDAITVASIIDRAQGLKTDTFAIGADTPLAGGLLKTQFAFGKAKNHSTYNETPYIKNLNGKASTLSLAAAYEYNLSKQSMLYIGCGYSYDKFKVDFNNLDPIVQSIHEASLKGKPGAERVKMPKPKQMPTHHEVKFHNYEVMMGLVHKF